MHSNLVDCSSSSVANSTAITNLPYSAATYGTLTACAVNVTSFGVGIITGGAYTPTWTTVNNSIVISGTYITA